MAQSIITAKDLTKDYGEGRGIFGLDFQVAQGEAFGIVGTNGSGKTTTLRHLMGFLRPDRGSCRIKDLDCRRQAHKIMESVGYVPGEIDFPDVGSAATFLRIQAQYLGIKDTKRINELVERFGLDIGASLKRMSKGMKQKTALIAAFMAQREIYLLDEPSTGLDPLMRDALIELINQEKARGATILMSSHIFKELEDTCDSIMFIHEGKRIDMIDKTMHTPDLPKMYRVGFKNREEYQSLLAVAGEKILHKNDDFLHADVLVDNDKTNDWFSLLTKFDLRYMKYRPFTLEYYYTEKIEKGGKINAELTAS